jgi:hypothetical protein
VNLLQRRLCSDAVGIGGGGDIEIRRGGGGISEKDKKLRHGVGISVRRSKSEHGRCVRCLGAPLVEGGDGDGALSAQAQGIAGGRPRGLMILQGGPERDPPVPGARNLHCSGAIFLSA